jgi:hypothetical protein
MSLLLLGLLGSLVLGAFAFDGSDNNDTDQADDDNPMENRGKGKLNLRPICATKPVRTLFISMYSLGTYRIVC